MAPSSGQGLAAVLPVPFTEHAAAVLEPVAGQSCLLRVVRSCLDAVDDPARVIVAAAEPLAGDLRQHLVRDGLDAVNVTVADGPATRAACLAVALKEAVSKPVSASSVLVYDVRQPLTTAALGDRVVRRLAEGAAVVLPVLAVTDSVKAVDEHGAIIASLDRSTLQSVQHPRGFAVADLRRLLTGAVGEFDEVLEAIRAAVPIATVDGDPEAIAVDLPHDAPFLEAVIASRRAR
ncbi:2-C-methyl-D-erythritol 4-phosphate cytidylyltransferase [Mycolicibacterium sp. GF69]|uniref:IspD/TarI family cytidylyltransferase n=1 Tax=Mycolicibacterium sp. GF69 TaxID=2267251 RepID=UPI001403C61C|nr:2-C-methyl-D-erythritol 4-phosphate cytidylyltransferase [Mycolicibacterium sp. GF69]